MLVALQSGRDARAPKRGHIRLKTAVSLSCLQLIFLRFSRGRGRL